MPKRLKQIALNTGLYKPLRLAYDHILNRSRLAERKRLSDFHRQFVAPGGLCFDIGANMGDYAASLLDLGSTVVMVEPQPECLAELRARFSGNPNAIIVPKAISDRITKVQLHLSAQGTNYASLNPDWHNVGDSTVDTETTTLDALITQYGRPSFCKIDVEGSELDALTGLSSTPDCLSIEYTMRAGFEAHTMQCLDAIERIGPARFNVSPALENRLQFDDFVDRPALDRKLREMAASHPWGDVYVRFQ